MKIIVCGGGNVGKSIVRYLVHGDNDIIVIEKDAQVLDEISKEFDIQPILGNSAHPKVLERAGAKTADLLLAVTDHDEANLVTCQVAKSLFNLPQRIARIDSEAYLSPLWSTIFCENCFPVDLIISPDIAIAEAVLRILKFPGTSEALPFFNDKLYLIGIKCDKDSPRKGLSVSQLGRLAPDLSFEMVSIFRKSKIFIPQKEDKIYAGDELYLLVKKEDIAEAAHAFGREHPANERIIIFGGTKIAYYLGRKLENDDNLISCKIIEEDYQQAKRLAQDLPEITVIHGPLMSDVILEEAGLANCDASVAITDKDKDNLLLSLLAKKGSAGSAISLVNSPAYNNLVDNIGDNILVDRSTVTVSHILKEIRKTKIDKAYSLGRGAGEIWQLTIDENSSVLDKKISDLPLDETVKICVVEQDGELIPPTAGFVLKEGTRLAVYMNTGAVRKAEKIFS